MRKHVVIIGAGVAGLSCALELARAGMRVTVLEREPQVGGMAASFEEGDRESAGQPGSDYWSWDFGPHRFHSDKPELMAHAEEILGGNHVWSKRLSRIFLFDRFFDYPLVLSNVLRNMPRLTLLRVLFDYAWTRLLDTTGLRKYGDRNFKEWVERRFGAELSRIFFTEYTEKTWGLPATQVSSAWAKQRISLLSLGDTIKRTIFKPRDIPRTLITDFIYPKVGGIGELSRCYARKIEEFGGRVLVATPVVRLYRDGQRVTAVEYQLEGEKRVVEPDDLVSTIPITGLLQCLEPKPPQEVRLAAKNLGYVSIIFIYLKLSKPQVSPDSWIYLPQKTLRVHRISEFKNFSKLCAPPDQTLVCAEIACTPGEGLWRATPEELRDIAVDDLYRVGLIRREEVLSSFVKRVWHAYPLYDLDYEKNLKPIMDFVHGLENLRSSGRQGLYRYSNMDQSIEMGRRAAHATLQVGDADFEAVATEQKYFG
jgi:protoporphyrinogen oxidase